MHRAERISAVRGLQADGLGARRIAQRTNLPLSTVRDWLAGRLPRTAASGCLCPRCGHPTHRLDELPPEYTYLLGLYLGDGCLSRHPRDVFRLRIFLDLKYPGIIDEGEAAINRVLPGTKVQRTMRGNGYSRRPDPSHVVLSSFSRSWICLFPQHGAGRKHERAIALAGWQLAAAEAHPELLLRGLIHSDGCRSINTGRGGWKCPRYSFSNRSSEIREIFRDACRALELNPTDAGEHTVYVSRRADVERLDRFIGPKR